MIRTIEAIFDEEGRIVLPSGVTFDGRRHRALVLILDEAPPAPPTVHSKSTTTAHDRYQMLDLLGAGGMGEVFRAFDQQSKTIVCLKRLHDGIRPAALRQELLALQRLNHPNIIALLDQSLESATPYLVTEFVDGPNLASWLGVHRPIPELLAADIMQQIFDGLAFAHSHQIIHCDLKPGNVMVELEGARLKPRILDFGLAVVDRLDDRGAITAAGRVAGTLDYMAPEQFRGDVLTPACDVYAAGLMLATLTTGVSTYSGLGDGDIAYQKLSAQSGLRLTASGQALIAGLVEHCTHPAPDNRPSAGEAAAALRRLTAGLQHPVRPINLEFTQGLSGWENGMGKVANASPKYAAGVLLDRDGGPIGATFQSLGATPGEFGVLMQSFPAERLIGERIRLQADVATHEVDGRAALWCRIDAKGSSLAFDNMVDRPISGTTDNRQVGLELVVPDGAESIHFGLLLAGTGLMTVRKLALTLAAGQARPDLALISSRYP